ncbi:MAG: LuxR C-terminal-related transcriptional regulator [Syntrophobacter sp.]
MHGQDNSHAPNPDLFRLYADKLPDMVCRYDSALRFIYVNPVVEKVTGLSAGAIIGRTHFEIGIESAIASRWSKALAGVFRTGRNATLEFTHPSKDGILVFQGHLIAEVAPDGSVSSVLTISRDITELKAIESKLRKREADLSEKAGQLEEINTALKILLRQREADKKELEESLLANVKQSILPCLQKLGKSRLDENQRKYLKIAQSQFENIISPFLNRLSSRFTDLTPTEIRIAGLIKEGMRSKEIADILGIAEQTVLTHRNNLRAKLGLRKEKANLRSYLMSLT